MFLFSALLLVPMSSIKMWSSLQKFAPFWKIVQMPMCHSRLMVARLCSQQQCSDPLQVWSKHYILEFYGCMSCFRSHCAKSFQLRQKIGASCFVVCQRMLHTISWLIELQTAPNVASTPPIFVSWDSVGFVVWFSIGLNCCAINTSLTVLEIKAVVNCVTSIQRNIAKTLGSTDMFAWSLNRGWSFIHSFWRLI